MKSYVFFILLILCSISCDAAESEFTKALKTSGRNIVVKLPEYPPESLTKGIVGRVLFDFRLDEKGFPKEISIVESEPAGVFDTAVLKALRSWQYLPNMDQPCNVESSRFRQQIWFEIQGGEPRISMSKVLDLPAIQPISQINPDDGRNKTAVATVKDDDRLVILDNSGFRIKEGTLVRPEYPLAARKQGIQGVVVGYFHIFPDGSVVDVSIPYSVPPGVFDSAVKSAMMKYQLEQFSGKPPGRAMKVCISFTFALSD